MVAEQHKSEAPQSVTVDIGKYGGPIFIGRNEGAAMREKFRLDDYDGSEAIVNVTFPDTSKGIGSSFFLAMFGKSIRKAGSKLEFLSKYRFFGPDFLIEDLIQSNIERALFEGSLFDHSDSD